MSLNIIWSVLAQGTLYQGPSARRMDETLYTPDIEWAGIFECLFGGLDPIQTQFHIEQYTQLTLDSILREKALDIDPINTYDKTSLTFVEAGFTNNAPDPVKVHYTPGNNPMNYSHKVSIDVTTPTATIDNNPPQAFTYAGNLSSYIDLPSGDRIRLGGEMPVSDYFFHVQNNVPLKVDYRKRIALLLSKNPLPWTDPELRHTYVNEINWVDTLASVILQAVIANSNNL